MAYTIEGYLKSIEIQPDYIDMIDNQGSYPYPLGTSTIIIMLTGAVSTGHSTLDKVKITLEKGT